MTSYIKSHLDEELSSAFIAMLYDYGAWSRYSGCCSYPRLFDKPESYSIDDESALILDRCFQELKNKSQVLFIVMMLHYQSKLDSLDIHVLISHKKRYRHLRLNSHLINDMINVGTQMIYTQIKEMF